MVTSTDELQGAVGHGADGRCGRCSSKTALLGEIAFREVLQHLLAGLNGADASVVAAAAPAPARASGTQSDIDDTICDPGAASGGHCSISPHPTR